MPVIVDGHIWAGKKPVRSAGTEENVGITSENITLALVNNMPDSALEDTELQFFELLNNASGHHLVSVELYTLPDIPRNHTGAQRINSFYFDINDLLSSHFDGVIITGTEPLQTDLQEETYWPVLTRVLDWAEQNSSSTVLSCLAAHAGVLYSDRIRRQRLPEKQFGVFSYQTNTADWLTQFIPDANPVPHSRWNDLREGELVEAGYTVLTRSIEGGVDSFTKKKRDSLFVHLQGHPEYFTDTLLKEYRRDIKRFLRRERETYPPMPVGYFDGATASLLTNFRENLLSDPREEQSASFPDNQVVGTLSNTWAVPATELYRNWLRYLLSRKGERSAFVSVT